MEQSRAESNFTIYDLPPPFYDRREAEDYYEYEGEDGRYDDTWSLDSRGFVDRKSRGYEDAVIYPDDDVPTESMTIRKTIPETVAEGLEARFSVALGFPGLARLDLSPLTQKICACVIDDNVTTEYPWVYVKKEIIEDNLFLHSESSDFLPVKEEMESYPDDEILIGYAPNLDFDGQFYVCTTREAQQAVAQYIEDTRHEQQERVRKALYKVPRRWPSMRTTIEIVKQTRPLYEVQIESRVAQLKAPRDDLGERTADMQRDGYVELVPYRETYDNVESLLIDQGADVVPKLADRDAQTATAGLINATNQCILDQEPMYEAPVPKKKELEAFIRNKTADLIKMVADNETWDTYSNDYAKLTTGEDLRPISVIEYKEEESYFNGGLCMGKVSSLSWHPTCTGVVACAYSRFCRGEYNPALTRKAQLAMEKADAPVLIWSLDDALKPKLVLESKKRVVRVSFCPWDGNILIGGCISGQIVIWDLTGVLEDLEFTPSRLSWPSQERGKEYKRATATSSEKLSQKNTVTDIKWLPPHSVIDKKGIINEVEEDARPEDYGSQFMTSSLNGTIAFWDLKWQPIQKKVEELRKKKRKLGLDPGQEEEKVSSFAILDDLFQPIYQLKLQTVDLKQNVKITAMSTRPLILSYEPVVPRHLKNKKQSGIKKKPLAERKYYKVTVERDPAFFKEIFVGTMSSGCGLVTWDGIQFSRGEDMNSENAKWTWRFDQMDEVPISYAVRARHMRNVVLTVGGKTFAIWRDDFGHPVFSRKGPERYTSCDWNSVKPNLIVLGRQDGTLEVWDFFESVDEPIIRQSVSGKITAGIYSPKMLVEPQFFAVCDYNGNMRMFLVPESLTTFKKEDVTWMQEFIEHQYKRIFELKKIEEKQAEIDKVREEEEKKNSLVMRSLVQEEVPEVEPVRKRKNFEEKLEESRQKWLNRELLRMQAVILEKKGLRGQDVEKGQEPLLKMKREEKERENRKIKVAKSAMKYYEQTIKENFPMLAEEVVPSEPETKSVKSVKTLKSGKSVKTGAASVKFALEDPGPQEET